MRKYKILLISVLFLAVAATGSALWFSRTSLPEGEHELEQPKSAAVLLVYPSTDNPGFGATFAGGHANGKWQRHDV